MPTTPYTTNEAGHGPAWSNSLFEDNAEFGLGMALANRKKREEVRDLAKELLNNDDLLPEVKTAIENWLTSFSDSTTSRETSDALEEVLKPIIATNTLAQKLFDNRDYFVKISQWMFGGDGWAYDIGYGGLDHVLASGEDVNILVMDNEVYSNTGGQKSKGTPAAAIAKFAASGKDQAKKDLGRLAITYGNVYVAQICADANAAQTIKAMKEAEEYPGPSLIIAYTPCINHGLKGGMGNYFAGSKAAVDSGYWALYRYNPLLEVGGKTPLTLDFKRPDFTKMKDFMLTQVRFSALEKQFPKHAPALFAKTVNDAKERFKHYAKMSGDYEKIKEKVNL
jgi:pyruvate-ferredoxin/flavodoxin oxidoreductase